MEIGRRTRAKPLTFDLPNNEKLSASVLRMFQIGTDRAVQYCHHYYVANPYSVERSEKDVPLTKILATASDQKNEQMKIINRAVSLSANELDKAMVLEEVGEELLKTVQLLNETYNVSPQIPVPMLSRLTKKLRIQDLILFRRLLFEKDRELESRLRKEAQEEFEKIYPATQSNDSGVDVQRTNIYRLDKNVFDLPRYSTHDN